MVKPLAKYVVIIYSASESKPFQSIGSCPKSQSKFPAGLGVPN